jgi:hypothetical protein
MFLLVSVVFALCCSKVLIEPGSRASFSRASLQKVGRATILLQLSTRIYRSSKQEYHDESSPAAVPLFEKHEAQVRSGFSPTQRLSFFLFVPEADWRPNSIWCEPQAEAGDAQNSPTQTQPHGVQHVFHVFPSQSSTSLQQLVELTVEGGGHPCAMASSSSSALRSLPAGTDDDDMTAG